MTLERNTLLNNRYRIIEILGQGGMGSVYRATDENLGVEVAVKDNLFTTEEYARQFRLEATILATLRHSNLPRVTDHFVIEGQGQYLVMDYIEGEDLRQHMERAGLLQEEEVITIGAAVCDALAYLASRTPPIIHRDIKPGNVRISPQGQIFLVDFGLAKTLRGSQTTTTGARAMTPGFSPPEQYGTARTDHRSDIFSLGATLYAALTGNTPEDALARAMDQSELTPIRKYNPKTSKRLAVAIEKAVEVRPDDRYQSAEDFKQALIAASTSNKRREGEYIILSPPDLLDGRPLPEESRVPIPELDNKAPLFAGPPQQLFIPSGSAEFEQIRPSSKPRKRASRRGCWVVLLMVMIALAGFGVFIYRYAPDLPMQTIARLWPVIVATNLPPTDIDQGATPTSAVSALKSKEPTSTNTPTDIPMPTLTPSITPTATMTPTETPTPVPTLIGGSGRLAFVSKNSDAYQISVINADGTGYRMITDMPEGACQPSWSPDGQKLVFVSPCQANRQDYPGSGLYLINLDGSGLQPLPRMAGGDYDPKWSPDGTQIVFTSLRNSARPQLFLLTLADNTVEPLSEKLNYDIQPSWSPDGKMIIFVSLRRGTPQIWVMDADGSNQQQFSKSLSYLDYYPNWSPDGKSVVFTQFAAPNGAPWVSIATFSFDNYQEYRLTQEPMPMREAVFSPDGYWIAFEGWEVGGSHNIYIVSVSGAGRQQVTSFPGIEFDPAWRPVP